MCLGRDEYVDSFICINIGMKDDLVELIVHLNCNCVVMGSNLGLNKIILILLKLTLAWTWRVTQTLAREERPNKEREGARESAIGRCSEEIGCDRKSGIGRRATKAIGDQGVNREFTKLSKESRLGEFLLDVLILIAWIRDMREYVGMPSFKFIRVAQVSRNPETAWRSCLTCQATQAPDPVFWVFSMNRLTAENDSPGDTN